MPESIKPATAVIWQGFSPILLARVLGNAGTPIVQADITSITRNIYKLDRTLVSTAAVVVASSVFNTLQTDARWDVDDVGYNFADQPPVSNFADGNAAFFVEYVFTPVAGEIFPAMFRVNTQQVPS